MRRLPATVCAACRSAVGSPLALLLTAGLGFGSKPGRTSPRFTASDARLSQHPDVAAATLPDSHLGAVVLLAYAVVQLPRLQVLEVTHNLPGVVELCKHVLGSSELSAHVVGFIGAQPVRCSSYREQNTCLEHRRATSVQCLSHRPNELCCSHLSLIALAVYVLLFQTAVLLGSEMVLMCRTMDA